MTIAVGTRIPLLDGWEVRPVLGDAWRWEVARALESPPSPGWMPARVPGSVLDDAWRAGLVPDPERDLGSLAAEWVPTRHWVYRRALRGDSAWRGRRVTLELEGVDWAASAWIDGAVLGEHASQLVPWRIDLTGRLAPDRDATLLVVLAPAPSNESQVGDTSRVRLHRTRMTEGWDFCPRLPHLGLWRPASLRLTGAARLDGLGVTVDLVDGEGRLAVRPEVDLAIAGRVGIAVRVSHDGRVLAETSWSGEAGVGSTILPAIGVRVPGPPVWHVNGEGPQPRCELSATVSLDGVPSDTAERRIGFRSLRFVTPHGAPAGARAYTPVVNGRAVPVRGWNWVPVDARYGVPRPDRIAHLVDLAQRARVNVLRVWGGGLVEGDAFYDACDAAGILVWQELLQSSSGIGDVPSAHPSWAETLAAEARLIAPRISHHPSLALWCGGNELRGEDGAPGDERQPAIAAARDAVAAVDPGRPWLPTSPSGPTFLFTAPGTVPDERPDDLHDVHGPWEHQGLAGQQALWGGRLALLHSEFGAPGMCGREQLEATVSADLREPPTRDNPVMRHRGDWWIDEPGVRAAFGSAVAGDLERIRRGSRYLQAEGLRVAVEAARRAWPRTAGTLPWQLDESFPNAWSTAAIDHDGRPRPAYHAVRRAYRTSGAAAWVPSPALGGARQLEGRAWGWCEHVAPDAVAGMRVEIRTADGRGAARGAWPDPETREHRLRPNGVVGPVRFALQLPEANDDPATRVLVLDVALRPEPGGTTADGGLPARYLLTRAADLAPLLALPATRLETHWSATGVIVRNVGTVLALDVHLALPSGPDGVPAVALDDAFHLLPGEEHQVAIAWRAVPADARQVAVDAWNAPAVIA